MLENSGRRGAALHVPDPPGQHQDRRPRHGADFVVDAALVSRFHCRLTAPAPPSSRWWTSTARTAPSSTASARRARSSKTGDRLGVGRVELDRRQSRMITPPEVLRSERDSSSVSRPIVVARSVARPHDRVVGDTRTAPRGSIAAASSMSPPGRSVRPIEPANSVSPTKSVHAPSRPSRPSPPSYRQADAARAVSGRVQHANLVAAEPQRPLPVIEAIDRRLRSDREPEHLSLLHGHLRRGSCRRDGARRARRATCFARATPVT